MTGRPACHLHTAFVRALATSYASLCISPVSHLQLQLHLCLHQRPPVRHTTSCVTPRQEKSKETTPFFPQRNTTTYKAKKKSQQNTQATTKTGNNSQRVPPRERERIVSHLSILVENIQPAFARPRVRLEKELHRGMRARAYHGVYLWAIRISSEQPCLIVHQGGLARTVRRQSCERNRCVVGVFVPPASPPPSFIPTTTSPRALELESSQVAPSSHDSHHRAQI